MFWSCPIEYRLRSYRRRRRAEGFRNSNPADKSGRVVTGEPVRWQEVLDAGREVSQNSA